MEVSELMDVRTGEPNLAQPASEEHVVIFRLGDENYALDIQWVQEIVRLQSITSVPGSDAWVYSVTNLRGRVVPVIDLRVRCGINAAPFSAETRIVVVNGEEGMVGLIVDAVTEVMRIPASQVEPPGSMVGEHTFLRGIAKLEGRLVSLMDLRGILPGATPDEAAMPAPESEAEAA